MQAPLVNELRQKDTETLLPDEAASQSTQLSSQELFRTGNTVRIEHAGQTYWLRLTRGNKLILTK
jgi:hemin uptake protein HemP